MDDVEVENIEEGLNFKKNLNEYTGLELAYLGDAIWELEVRKHFLKYGYNILKLNKIVKSNVNAKVQSMFYNDLINDMELNDIYKSIGKRAKNSNIKTFPKSCSIMEYKNATAFEAIIGALYLNNETNIISNILKKSVKGDKNGNI